MIFAEDPVPQRGIWKNAHVEENRYEHLQSHNVQFKEPSKSDKSVTWWKLLRQSPFRRIGVNSALRITLGGKLSLESAPKRLLFGPRAMDSLKDFSTALLLGAYDPRINGLFIEFSSLQCGYAKLSEARRAMDLFRQSGKSIIGFADSVSEKELFLSLG